MDQVNFINVNGVQPQTCPVCLGLMNPNVAWWWTWHGATCSEICAHTLITRQHGADNLCGEDCRNPKKKEGPS